MTEPKPERAEAAADQLRESASTSAESVREPRAAGSRSADPRADEESAVRLLAAATQEVRLTPDAAPLGESAAARPGWNLHAWLRYGVDFVTETRFARRASRKLLALYSRALQSEPQLTEKALYTRVVSLYLGTDAPQTEGVLLRAEQSFCQWPAEHALRFRDVVSYLVVTEYLRKHRSSPGTQTNMLNVVARAVPDTC